jgi:hypothetical protein
VYAYRFLNRVKQNYNTIEREALVMVFPFHKFRHYLLGNKFFFSVDHMALVHLVNKPPRFPKGEEHLHFEGDVCEDWMETTPSPKHFQHLQQHLQRQK